MHRERGVQTLLHGPQSSALASVVVAGVGAATASLWSATLDVLVVSMGLQLGYVAGGALETYAAVRGRRRALRESRQAADASFEPATALNTNRPIGPGAGDPHGN